jgi:hypothetical protein
MRSELDSHTKGFGAAAVILNLIGVGGPGAALNFPSPRWISPESPYETSRPWWEPSEYLPHLHGSVFLTDYGRGCEDKADKYAWRGGPDNG